MDGSSANPMVFDVGEQDFLAKVVEASKQAPVVVDFWADWCGPCRMLGPILEREVRALGGKVSLAKLDVEANRELAGQFEIQGIPAVKAFSGGKVVAEFEGARDPGFVKRWLQQLAPASESAKQLAAAKTAAELRALLDDPEVGAKARLLLAEKLIAEGQAAEAVQTLEAGRFSGAEAEKAQALTARAQLAADAERSGGEAAARAALAARPDDLEARWSLASALMAKQAYAEALEHYLAIVSAQRRFKDDGARKAMLMIFDSLGPAHELTKTFRHRLMVAL